MIPPLMGSTPVPDSTDQPGEGFANAMAAALVMAPPPPAAPPPASTGQDVASSPAAPIPPGSTLTVPAPAPFTTMPDQIARLATPTLSEYGAGVRQVADSIVTSAGNPTPVATTGNPTQVATPAGPVPPPPANLEMIERPPAPTDLKTIGRPQAPSDVEMIEPAAAPTVEPAEVVTPEMISELTTAEATAEVPRPALVAPPMAPPRPASPTTLTRAMGEATPASAVTAPNGPRPDVAVTAESATPQGAAALASDISPATRGDAISVPDARRSRTRPPRGTRCARTSRDDHACRRHRTRTRSHLGAFPHPSPTPFPRRCCAGWKKPYAASKTLLPRGRSPSPSTTTDCTV